jgi:biopolymer transport protein ExbD
MFKEKPRRKKAGLALAPMLDLIFILLIFFVVSTSFSKLPGININRPDAKQPDRLPPNNVMIGITIDGTYVINERTLSQEQLKETLQLKFQANPKVTVLIVADEESKLKFSVFVMDVCKQIGIERFAIAEEKI